MKLLSRVAAAVAVSLAPLGADAQTTIITGVTVIPMDREAAIPNQMVVIEGGRITQVGAERAVNAPSATRVDGRGKFLIPGLAEFHAHVPSGAQSALTHRTLSLYALAGVTTARGMLGAPMHLALRDSLQRGLILGPRLITSGPSFNNNTVTSPEGAMAMVRDQKGAGYDLLKIHPGVPRIAFDSLAVTANRVGIPFSGHVPLEIGLDVALTAKYSTIDHLDGFIEAMYAGAAPLTPQLNGFFGLGIISQIDRTRLPAIVQRVKASGVAMVPTQILMDNYASAATGDELTSLPEMRYWVPQQIASWKANKDNVLANLPATRAQRDEYIALRRRILKDLHAAGVMILLGSDAPQLWNVPGFSTHRELEALVNAGLTPFQALQTGTVNIAKFLNEEGASGVIRAGARADLILLDANPLDNIANTQRIAGVIVNGRWIGAAEREQRLQALASGTE